MVESMSTRLIPVGDAQTYEWDLVEIEWRSAARMRTREITKEFI